MVLACKGAGRIQLHEVELLNPNANIFLHETQSRLGPTWAPKVFEIIAVRAIFRGFGLLCYLPLGVQVDPE